MEGIAQTRVRYGGGDHRWMADLHGLNTPEGGTLDGSLFPADVFPDGLVPSGTVLARVTATDLYGPYSGTTDEVQTVTVTGSPTGGTFTLTFSGQTTTAIAFNATAAVVQSALEALSNVGVGDVVVTGSAGGPFTVTFAGALADTNVASLTATASLTGGTTPGVTIATTTAGGVDGGSDGREVARGHLVSDQLVSAGSRNDVALLTHGAVYRNRLPANAGLDAAAEADLKHIRYRNF